VLERHGETVVVDTNTAIVLAAEEENRVSHPGAGGDDCTVVIVPSHQEAAGGIGGGRGRLRPRVHVAVSLFIRASDGRAVGELWVER
jgi:hypothetical protein